MNAPAKAEIAVHPLAELFPMFPPDELEQLADDIRVNGLLNAIMLDANGQLIDGRNRLKACQMAKVEPRFETYSGDPIAFIWSINDRRRHMSKGQRAIVAAMADPDPAKGGRGNKALKNSSVSEVGQDYLSRARLVLKYADNLAEAVRIGGMGLSEAYEVAKRNKAAAESAPVMTEQLRTNAPDLAEMVLHDQLKLSEALAAYQARQSQDLTECKAATLNLARIVSPLILADMAPDVLARRLFERVTPEFWPGDSPALAPAMLRAAAAVITATANMIEKGENKPWQKSAPFRSEQ